MTAPQESLCENVETGYDSEIGPGTAFERHPEVRVMMMVGFYDFATCEYEINGVKEYSRSMVTEFLTFHFWGVVTRL